MRERISDLSLLNEADRPASLSGPTEALLVAALAEMVRAVDFAIEEERGKPDPDPDVLFHLEHPREELGSTLLELARRGVNIRPFRVLSTWNSDPWCGDCIAWRLDP